MYKIALFLVVALAMVQDIKSCCCVSREPYMTQTCLECLFDLCPCFCPPKCGCFKDITNPMGSSSCGCQCPCFSPPKCGCFKDIANPMGSSSCGCQCPCFSPPKCGCFKDIAKTMGSSSCGCQCGCKSLYFPEVEYPCTSFNMNPFYFGSCFQY